MKKIIALVLVVAASATLLVSCKGGKNPANTTTHYTGTTINTVPPAEEEIYTIKPGAVTFEKDESSSIENAIKLVSFKTVNHTMIIGDKYMDEFGNVHTITCIGVGPGSRVPAKNDTLFTVLEVLGGETKRIASSSFQGSRYLGNVKIGEGVETIGEYAFYSCTKLKLVALPETLKEIGPMAFCDTGIEEIVVPAGVTKIGKLAFANCPSLKKVTLPASFNDEALLREIFVNYDHIKITFAE